MLLYGLLDFQVGATEEEIDRLPKFKFQTTGDIQKVNGDIQESCGGIMTECDTDSPIEHALSKEHAVSFSHWQMFSYDHIYTFGRTVSYWTLIFWLEASVDLILIWQIQFQSDKEYWT